MPDKNGMLVQPLTPIPCTVCGWIGKGRYANRSTVCRYCRARQRKILKANEAKDAG